jgi:hypothetical protein
MAQAISEQRVVNAWDQIYSVLRNCMNDMPDFFANEIYSALRNCMNDMPDDLLDFFANEENSNAVISETAQDILDRREEDA